MPQLDYILIPSQIFWFVIIFVSLYIIIICFFLPKISRIFKIRKFICKKNFQEIKQIYDVLKIVKSFRREKVINCLQVFKFLVSNQLLLKEYSLFDLIEYDFEYLVEPISDQFLYNRFKKLCMLIKFV